MGPVPNNLLLKLGTPIMPLWNLDPTKLCNVATLTIKSTMPHFLEATFMSRKYTGINCFILRIPMKPTNLLFEFKRFQFPVRFSFSMTRNKYQGQSLKVIELTLSDSVFWHGQIYIGFSRAGNTHGRFLLAPAGKTKNIAFYYSKELLENII